ncbi:hypothetical protein [Sphingosinicella sp.]|uniref:hypothetical protein n=1 Tax=Sphingosinicella sp. TaxID=1917971 RepID=UPI0040381046
MAENRFASFDAPAEVAADEPASLPNNSDAPVLSDVEGLPFDPVPLRYRADGLTPAKQREYVEALADTGLAREAAARVGVSEQAIARVRRRADARSFDLACDAAIRHGARRLRSIAFERAIEGTIKQHFYHGELKGEERVYDNRLLIWLLGKVDHLIDPGPALRAAANWEGLMEEVEQGPPPAPEPNEFRGDEVWEDEDGRWTGFPPPAGFDGEEEGEPGEYGYKRALSPAEQAVIDGDEEEERLERLDHNRQRRDRYFGFDGGDDAKLFSPMEAETSETSGPARP